MSDPKQDGVTGIAVNRKARHEYATEEQFEAGLVLLGSEVKSLRDGRITFKDSYIQIKHGEAYWVGAHISGYAFAHQFDHDPERERKLLLRKNEILKLHARVREKGMSIIPLRLYIKGGKIKLEIALARGKKQHDKREDLKQRDDAREIARAMAFRRKSA